MLIRFLNNFVRKLRYLNLFCCLMFSFLPSSFELSWFYSKLYLTRLLIQCFDVINCFMYTVSIKLSIYILQNWKVQQQETMYNHNEKISSFLYMQIVAWSLTFNLKNRNLKDTTKALLQGPKNDLKKNAKLEAKYYHNFIICRNLPKSPIRTSWLLWINEESRNCRHEHELPVSCNQVTFWTNYSLTKCRILCILWITA